MAQATVEKSATKNPTRTTSKSKEKAHLAKEMGPLVPAVSKSGRVVLSVTKKAEITQVVEATCKTSVVSGYKNKNMAESTGVSNQPANDILQKLMSRLDDIEKSIPVHSNNYDGDILTYPEGSGYYNDFDQYSEYVHDDENNNYLCDDAQSQLWYNSM